MKTALVVAVIGLAIAGLWFFQWDYRIEYGHAIRINRLTGAMQQRSCFIIYGPRGQRVQRASQLFVDVKDGRLEYDKLNKDDQIEVYSWMVYKVREPKRRQELGLPSVEDWEKQLAQAGGDIQEVRAVFAADELDEWTQCVWELAPSDWPQPQRLRRPWY